MQQQQLQSFPVIYDKTIFNVDLNALINSSRKFKELIDPFINDDLQMKEMHLEILCNKFTKRNIDNFLLICQKLPTDVQNSEMKEICEIAKMFKADKIYQQGLLFVQSYLDPNFNVPDNMYDGSDGKTYLIVVGEIKNASHNPDITKIVFENDTDSSNQILTDIKTEMNENPKINNIKSHTVVYQITYEKNRFKCPVYKFIIDDKTLYSAKQKFNEIFIAEGDCVHIHDKEKQIGHILRKESTISNTITTKDQVFEVMYNNIRGTACFPMNVSFQFKNRTLNWTTKKPKLNPETGKYSLNYQGIFNHTPIPSSKNTILQDKKGYPIFIIRKMTQTSYEIESLSVFNPQIIFSIGLSGILGPFFDPWMAAQYK